MADGGNIEKLEENWKTTFEALKVAVSGFNLVLQTVERNALPMADALVHFKAPMLFVRAAEQEFDSDETRVQTGEVITTVFFDIAAAVVAESYQAVGTELNKLKEDIFKKAMEDQQRGGLVQSTTLVSISAPSDVALPTQGAGFIVARFKNVYSCPEGEL